MKSRLMLSFTVLSSLLVLLTACKVTEPTPPPTAVEVVAPPPAGKLYHGVYPGALEGTGDEDDLALTDLQSYENAAGKQAAWVYFSHNWFNGRQFPSETAGWIRSAGSVPYIRLMMRSSIETDIAEPIYTLPRIIKGDFDADLRAWARAAKTFGTSLIAEFGTEMNGEWFSWNGFWNGGGRLDGYGDPSFPDGPERFRDAYRHIIDLTREEGAHNIIWVFHVSADDLPDERWNRFENYYPGEDYIDWIGVSIYGAQKPQDNYWITFRAQMDASYPRLEALAAKKPIYVMEFGVTQGNPRGNQERWAEAALRDMTEGHWPLIKGFSWWNEAWQNDDNSEHDSEMRLQKNPQLEAVFKRYVGRNDKVLARVSLKEC